MYTEVKNSKTKSNLECKIFTFQRLVQFSGIQIVLSCEFNGVWGGTVFLAHIQFSIWKRVKIHGNWWPNKSNFVIILLCSPIWFLTGISHYKVSVLTLLPLYTKSDCCNCKYTFGGSRMLQNYGSTFQKEINLCLQYKIIKYKILKI